MNDNFECKRCGKCCNECFNTIKVTPEDIDRWEEQGRTDILKYQPIELIDIESYESEGLIDFFFDPETGEPLDKCPFLEEIENGLTRCTIHVTKPAFCRNYICTNR